MLNLLPHLHPPSHITAAEVDDLQACEDVVVTYIMSKQNKYHTSFFLVDFLFPFVNFNSVSFLRFRFFISNSHSALFFISRFFVFQFRIFKLPKKANFFAQKSPQMRSKRGVGKYPSYLLCPIEIVEGFRLAQISPIFIIVRNEI